MKKWELLNKLRVKSEKFKVEGLTKVLLENRGIKTKKEIDEFLSPSLENLTTKGLEVNKSDLAKSLKRIKEAIKNKEQIIIFGDYDVDGITGTAILWETLNNLHANVMPYIPHRVEEGYGLSVKGIENLKKEYPDVSLIITVDNGIVANTAVEFANSLRIDVIITDHHVLGRKLPKAFSIVHSTKICGAAVAWFLSRVILNSFQDLKMPKQVRHDKTDSIASPGTGQYLASLQNDTVNEHLALVALATVADVMKLTGFNRALLVKGLGEIRKTDRPGLLALFDLSKIDKDKIGVYELGYVIGPRINAMGRLSHGLDSLRLLCTKDPNRAESLAQKLNSTNLERQRITIDSVLHAKGLVGEKNSKKLLFISSETYEAGVIGLIAGKLTEEYYRPSIVISVGEVYSKASARSVFGFNIIEFIRLSSSLLVDAGGHPMAAGFSVETKKIPELKKHLEELSEKMITPEMLSRVLRIDCELSLDLINNDLFESFKKLSPFGYGNPEPTFLAKKVLITDVRRVGKEQNHLKLKFELRSDLDRASNEGRTFNVMGGILFGYDKSLDLKIGDKVDIVYTISENIWNGNKKLELKIKDIKIIRKIDEL